MLPQYFKQELANLRELGTEFAKAHPSLAPMLGGPQADPDVERLLEGTAFLTALLRQKLDDEFPEIVQDLMQIVAPQYLRPSPSATIQVFKPKATVRHTVKLPAGISCASVPVEGVSCLFRTSYPLEIHPLTITDAAYQQRPGESPMIRIAFELHGLSLAQWKPDSVRLYLADDFATATDLYWLLSRHLKGIHILSNEGGQTLHLEPTCLRPVGFDRKERLIPSPSNAYPGFGVIQDYFLLPEKFLFLDVVGWERWSHRGIGTSFEIRFELQSAPPHSLRLNKESFVLNATPAVNLFSQEAAPIYIDHRRTQYPIRPSGSALGQQIFSVDEVKGFVQETCEERLYESFDRFRSRASSKPVYHLNYARALDAQQVDVSLSLAYPSQAIFPTAETLSAKLTCTHGNLPARLRAGDISIHGKGCPEYVTFANITAPTPGFSAPVGKQLLWPLLSHLSTGFQSFEREDVLKSLLDLYVPADGQYPSTLAQRKRIDSIQEVRATSSDRLVSGMVMRGREITLAIREDHFISRGDAFLFGGMLDSFFGNYASINSFTRLQLKDIQGGMGFSWPPRMGNRPLI